MLRNKILTYASGLVVLVIFLSACVPQAAPLQTTSPVAFPDKVAKPSPESTKNSKTIKTDEIPNAANVYSFGVTIPSNWEVEAVPAIEALNFYDPAVAADTNLEKSQIFIRYFRSSSFLTLSTVTIHSRTSTTVLGRPAVIYDIEKKPDVANFTNQPSWRNTHHMVTDIRLSDTNPSIFLVIAKRPDLDEKSFQDLLNSIDLNPPQQGRLHEPIKGFAQLVKRKPFGIFVTPQNSPVSPERFTGFHTGADAEAESDAPIFSIADGTVVYSGTASGYGGIVGIRHEINGQKLLGIYGHLRPTSLIAIGTNVTAGQRIGVLGTGFTKETDGERQHLHFGLAVGHDLNLKGYVESPAQLSDWLDPIEFFAANPHY